MGNCVEIKGFKSQTNSIPHQCKILWELDFCVSNGEGIPEQKDNWEGDACSSEEWLVEVLCLQKQLIVPFPTHLLYSHYTKSEWTNLKAAEIMDVTVDTVLNELTDKTVEEREMRTDTVVSSCGDR
jgi:hypothetical protein